MYRKKANTELCNIQPIWPTRSSASSSNQNEHITRTIETNTVNSSSRGTTSRTERRTESVTTQNLSSCLVTQSSTLSAEFHKKAGNNLNDSLPHLETSKSTSFSLRPTTRSSTRSKSGYPYKVKKTLKLHDDKMGPIPVYQTHSENRGTALILNNVKFHKETLIRKGAEKDENDLTHVLKQIGFQVENHRNVSSTKLRQILTKYPKQKSMKGDICMVVVMSHGSNRNIPGGYTEVLCSDGYGITTDDIIDYFDESKSPLSKGKPKIFIFQCCRDATERDANPLKPKPSSKSNTLIAHSTIPGFSSLRDPKNGSWYIQTLCNVLSEHAHEYHIEELLRIVDNELKTMHPTFEQVSCYENRGFSKCFLHPQ